MKQIIMFAIPWTIYYIGFAYVACSYCLMTWYSFIFITYYLLLRYDTLIENITSVVKHLKLDSHSLNEQTLISLIEQYVDIVKLVTKSNQILKLILGSSYFALSSLIVIDLYILIYSGIPLFMMPFYITAIIYLTVGHVVICLIACHVNRKVY